MTHAVWKVCAPPPKLMSGIIGLLSNVLAQRARGAEHYDLGHHNLAFSLIGRVLINL
jgi:hypothetical protein